MLLLSGRPAVCTVAFLLLLTLAVLALLLFALALCRRGLLPIKLPLSFSSLPLLLLAVVVIRTHVDSFLCGRLPDRPAHAQE